MIGKIIEATVIPVPEGEEDMVDTHTLRVLDKFQNQRSDFYLCQDEEDKSIHFVHPTWVKDVIW